MRIISLRQVQTDKDTRFTTELITNAGEDEDIPTGLECKEVGLVGIEIVSKQNLSWEIWFSSQPVTGSGIYFGNTNMDLDGYLGRYYFVSTDGKLTGDTVTSYYYSKELPSPMMLRDDTTADTKFNLHMRLVNRYATTKLATPDGDLIIRLALDTGEK